jgi:hypothetical protein
MSRLGKKIPGICLILACLGPAVSCDRRPSTSRNPGPNPVWVQVENLKRERRDLVRQILDRDVKPLDEAISSPLSDSPAGAGAIEPGSAVVLIHRNAGGWTQTYDVRLGVLQAPSPDKVRTAIAIKEIESSLGGYSTADGKPTDVVARQITWEARILSWPDLKLIAGKTFTGGLPDTVLNAGGQPGGRSVGSLPVPELSEWLSAWATGPARQPDQHEFMKLVFLGDSGKIALLGREDAVTIWDSETRRDVRTFSVRGASHKLTEQKVKDLEKEGITGVGVIMSLAASPDGRRIAAGGRDDASPDAKPVTYVWNADEGRELFELAGGNEPAFSPDGTHIVIASHEKGICLWDAERGTEVTKLAGSSGKQIWGMGFTSDGTSVWAAVPGGNIVFWEISTGKRVKTLKSGSETVKKVACASRSGAAITLEEQGEFPNITPVTRTWDFSAGTAGEALKWPGLPTGVAIDPAGKRVAVHDFDSVIVYEPETQRLICYIEPITKLDMWDPIAFSPDGRRLALIDQSGRVSFAELD